MPRVVVGPLGDLPDGGGVRVQAGGLRLAVFRLGAQVFAIEDHCPHRGFPLADGAVRDGQVQCRTHGSCFDLTNGSVVRGPAKRGVAAYRAIVESGRVEVEIED